MEKINVAELLRNCPKGMELDCTMYDNVVFDGVSDDTSYPIDVLSDTMKLNLTKTGGYSNSPDAKCVIFPKGKTTWEGFVPPCQFKDGDIVTSVFQGVVQGTGIFDYEEQSEAWIHACINLNNEFYTNCYLGHVYYLRLATEEEKDKLFQAIKEHGYKWNPETKSLEKLVEPKFKIGDIIKDKCNLKWKVINVNSHYYEVSLVLTGTSKLLEIKAQDDYELVPNKFDINTLVPFESRVLVRNDESQYWIPAFWGYKRSKYATTFGWCNYCIPFNGNEHLLETNDDCDEFYKTWK